MLGGNQIISVTTLCMQSAGTSFLFCSEFTCKIQQPIIKNKHSRTCNRYRKGGGGAIRKLWLLGIPEHYIQ